MQPDVGLLSFVDEMGQKETSDRCLRVEWANSYVTTVRTFGTMHNKTASL